VRDLWQEDQQRIQAILDGVLSAYGRPSAPLHWGFAGAGDQRVTFQDGPRAVEVTIKVRWICNPTAYRREIEAAFEAGLHGAT
jgi:hypothetical protein